MVTMTRSHCNRDVGQFGGGPKWGDYSRNRMWAAGTRKDQELLAEKAPELWDRSTQRSTERYRLVRPKCAVPARSRIAELFFSLSTSFPLCSGKVPDCCARQVPNKTDLTHCQTLRPQRRKYTQENIFLSFVWLKSIISLIHEGSFKWHHLKKSP